MHPFALLHEIGNDVQRSVRRAIIHDQDLCIPLSTVNAFQHAFKSLPDAFAFVIRGNNDADLMRHGGIHLSRSGWFVT